MPYYPPLPLHRAPHPHITATPSQNISANLAYLLSAIETPDSPLALDVGEMYITTKREKTVHQEQKLWISRYGTQLHKGLFLIFGNTLTYDT